MRPGSGFAATGPDAFKLFARLEKDGIPIIFHSGTSPMQEAPLIYAHPLTYDRVAMAFPKLKMILAHMGHPWYEDTIAVVRKQPNVYAEISAIYYRPWQFWNVMIAAVVIVAVGAERMDFIGKVENMAEGIAHVSRTLFGVADRATYDSDAKTGASSRLGEHYDERSRQIVAGLYREDFERFGYDASVLA